MMEDGRLLLINCLQALSEQLERPSNFHELVQRVDRQHKLVSHLWCEHGCLVGEILEALPASLYKHEATVALLEALDGEVMECLRCLQAYHMAQVRDWLCQPSVPHVHSYMHAQI